PPYWESYLCKLSPWAESYFRQIVELVRKYDLRGFHWADFWTVWPCDKTEHGHLAGKYSIYTQGKRMVQFAHQMHEAAPGLMLGADSGFDNRSTADTPTADTMVGVMMPNRPRSLISISTGCTPT